MFDGERNRRQANRNAGARRKDATLMGMHVRTKPQVLTLTEAAAARVREIMTGRTGKVAGLRVGVKNAGCAGMSYTMELAETAGPLDEVIEDKGVRVLVDPKAVLFLLGAEMDFVRDRLSAGFVFNNPNQTGACGCGESVSLSPAAPEGGTRS